LPIPFQKEQVRSCQPAFQQGKAFARFAGLYLPQEFVGDTEIRSRIASATYLLGWQARLVVQGHNQALDFGAFPP